jgi:galactokinase/mevalonate kinase-like predicted kinase
MFTKQKEVYMSRFQELKDLIGTFEKDFIKFYDKGNKSAGTRVRKSMNDLKRKAQEIRKEVQEIKAQAKEEKP